MRRELTERVQVAGHHGLRRPAPLRGEDGLGVLRLIEGGGLRRGQAHKPPRERLGRPARRAREWSATPRRGRRREAHELRSLERAGLSASEVVQSSGSGCGLPIAPAWRGCRPVFGNRRIDTWGLRQRTPTCPYCRPSISESPIRLLSPPNSTKRPWCTMRSMVAAANFSSPRIVPHLLNSMFVVSIRLRLS